MEYRLEKDILGEMKIPKDALWGLQAQRAKDNFIASGLPQFAYFYRALSQVKLACAQANLELGFLDKELGQALIMALQEMCAGQWQEHFIVDAMQGGAGTSTNLNINEIAANRANQLLQDQKITQKVDPFLHVNLHQSTNDVYPTAVKIALYYYLQDIEKSLNDTVVCLQAKEKEFATVLKMGRTQLMPAVPLTLGKSMGCFAEALARDRWRFFKCQERVRQVNLGGTAIGTGITAPRAYIFKAIEQLRLITNLPIARAENLIEATQNYDQLAEVFGMIKVLALNLEKIANDLRLLASFKEIKLPAVQIGSSVMPGKFNPVILEMIIMIAKKVIGNELIASLCIAKGELELNAFLPLVAYSLFESCELLNQGLNKLRIKCLDKLEANEEVSMANMLKEPTIATILLPSLGYEKSTQVANLMMAEKLDLKAAVLKMQVLNEQELNALLSVEQLCKLGF